VPAVTNASPEVAPDRHAIPAKFLQNPMSIRPTRRRRVGVASTDTSQEDPMSTTTRDTAAPATPARRPRTSTALNAGILAGPIFLAVSFAQIPFRDGFDVTKHAFSFLLIGPGAGLQIVNYLLVGALYALSGVGLRRTLDARSGRLAQLLATGLGVGLVVAGLFPPPPSFGYPRGAPAGMPSQLSASAVLHGVGFGLGVISWCVLLLLLAASLRRRAQHRWAVLALITGLALLLVPATSTQPYGTVALYIIVTAAYAMTSLLYARLSASTAG